MSLLGLSAIHIELSNVCNKDCYMCGRRKVEKYYPHLANYTKNIDLESLKKLSKQIPPNILTIFHNDGEPTCYPHLEKALKLFPHTIKTFNTNGILLLKKSIEIIGNLDTLVLSTFEDDPLWEQQFEIFQQFLRLKGDHKPNTIIRCLGNIDNKRMDLYKSTGSIIAKRILHSPMGSFEYTKETTIPEAGICLDFLNRLAINVDGDVYPCVRFNPNQYNKLGNINNESLEEIWNSDKRLKMLELHKQGKRNEMDLCNECQFWGVPRS